MSELHDRMTPRERVIVALGHRQPDRVPFSWGFCATAEMQVELASYWAERGIDWERLKSEAGDKVGIGPAYTGPAPAGGNVGLGIWGIQVKNVNYGTGTYDEFTGFPLATLETVAEVEAYPWPDPLTYDYDSLRAQVAQRNPNRYRAVQCGGGNPFEIYCWMTGLENAMMNLVCRPDLVEAGMRRITDYFERKLRLTLEQVGDQVDLVFCADDLGSQTGLLLSRECYRDLIQPQHKRLTRAVRELAPQAKVLFHTDGAVFQIIPDLMDAGVDVLEAVQTDAAGMDPEALKRTYGAQLSFHGGISVQQLLPKASAEEVEATCRRLVGIFGRDGGYIAAPSHAIQVGTPPENVDAMLRGVLGPDDYPALLRCAKKVD